MEVVRFIRPTLSCSASLVLVATAMAAGPVRSSDCCPTGGGNCTSSLDECDGEGCCSSGTCTNSGCECRSGQACRCGGACGFGRRPRSPEEARRWSEEWYAEHGHGPIGSSQRYRAGKLWPPYPRPLDNGQCSTQFHAAMYWPHPYNCWDRSWTKMALATQTANGWAQVTTLCAYHFDEETHHLNDAGRMHLRWILQNAPLEHRTVYVQADTQSHVSDARHAAVQNESTLIAGPGATQIIVQPVLATGRPANEVDAIRRTELQSMPRPRLNVGATGQSGANGGLQ